MLNVPLGKNKRKKLKLTLYKPLKKDLGHRKKGKPKRRKRGPKLK